MRALSLRRVDAAGQAVIAAPTGVTLAKLSASHFTSLFRQVIGLPPYAYLAKCRLEAAQRLLSETDDKIEKIAKSLGFSSSQHLAGQFRKTYGVTASEWRKSQRRPASSHAVR